MKLSTALLLASSALASDVLSLTGATFESTLSEKPLALVEFFAPWCGHCQKLAPEYETAATELKNKPDIAIAKVDCTEETELCASQGVQGYPTLKLFRGGDKDNGTPYPGARKADAIISYMTKQALPPVSILTSETLDDFSTSDKVVAVAFFGEDDKSSNETFTEVASSLRDDYLFGATNDADLAKKHGVKQPGLVVFKKFDGGKDVFEGSFKADDVKEFVKTAAIPLLGEIGPETYQGYMASGIPLAYLFVDSDATKEKLSGFVGELAAKFKGKVNFATIDAAMFGAHAENLNLKSEWPAFAIQDTVKMLKYPFDQSTEITAKSLGKFVEDFVAGKVEPSYKSEAEPEEQEEAVVKVVRTTYDKLVLDDKKDVLLEFYAPWCGHCKALKPHYEELAQMYAKHSDKLIIAAIDATKNDVPDDIKGFPTIKMFAAGKKDTPVEYQGNRGIDSFKEFIQNESTHKVKPVDPDVDEDETEEEDQQPEKEGLAAKVAAAVKDAVVGGDEEDFVKDEL
ncbi:protein disulfide-isomerase precursor [Savitreella phatthalungensis]